MQEHKENSYGSYQKEQDGEAVLFAENYLRLPHERREGVPSGLDTNSIVHEAEIYFLRPDFAVYPRLERELVLDLLDSFYEKILENGEEVRPNFKDYMKDWSDQKFEEIVGMDSEKAEIEYEVFSGLNLKKVRDYTRNNVEHARFMFRHSPESDTKIVQNKEKWSKLYIAVNRAYQREKLGRKR